MALNVGELYATCDLDTKNFTVNYNQVNLFISKTKDE